MAWQRRKAVFLVLLVLLLLGGISLYWFVSAHGFSAREKPTKLEALLARHARRIATPPGARNLKNPLDSTPLNIAEARDHFADHCAICHGNNGSGNTQINSGLYPPAPDIREGRHRILATERSFTSSRMAFALPACRGGAARMRKTGSWFCSSVICPNSFHRKLS